MSQDSQVFHHNPSYIGLRPELARLVPRAATRVLDIGCATGALGAAVKENTGAQVWGIEIDSKMASEASTRLDRVIVGDLEEWDKLPLPDSNFDCVICGDVLEHLRYPESVLRSIASVMTDEGTLILSLPNVGHLDTLVSLFIRKSWPMRSRGVHDETHLRWWARRDLSPFLARNGFTLIKLTRIFRIVERPRRINRVAAVFAIPPLRDLLTYQFVVLARRRA
jgi:methionine biosynthesis protein MetW